MINPRRLPTRPGTRLRPLPRSVAAALSVALLIAILGLLTAATMTATGSRTTVAHVLLPDPIGGPAPAMPQTAAAQPVEPHVIVIADYQYAPADLTVPAGTTITVENHDASRLTLTAINGDFDTGQIPPGGTATVTAPATPGTYPFHCAQLPVITGQLTVT